MADKTNYAQPNLAGENESQHRQRRLIQLANSIKEYFESDENAYPMHRSIDQLIRDKVREDEFGEVDRTRVEVGLLINQIRENESLEYRGNRNTEM